MSMRVQFAGLVLSSILAMGLAGAAAAQTVIPLSGFSFDPDEDVEITADTLSIDQDAQLVVFLGSVQAIHGEMTITADRINANYAEDDTGVDLMKARGNVRFQTETQTITADSADYNITDGTLFMSGNVAMLQEDITVTANSVNVDLDAGTGAFEGGVKTLFRRNSDK